MPERDVEELLGLNVDVLGVSFCSDRWQATCAVCGRRADAEYSARIAVGPTRTSLYLCEPCTIAALTVTFRRLASAITLTGPDDPRVEVDVQSESPF